MSLVNTFPQAFLEVLQHSLQHVGRNCCQFFPDVLLQIHRCPWFLFVHLALEISSEEEVLRLGTFVPMNTEVPKKYPLSHDRIVVFEISLHSKSPMLYRPAHRGNWNALSLARRTLKYKFPTPTVPLTTVLQNRQVFLADPAQIWEKRKCSRDICAGFEVSAAMWLRISFSRIRPRFIKVSRFRKKDFQVLTSRKPGPIFPENYSFRNSRPLITKALHSFLIPGAQRLSMM